MIKAHVTSVRVHGGAVEADSFTTGDTVDTGATVATTTSTETLIDTVIRAATAQAPTLPYLIVVPLLQGAPLLDAR